MVVRMRGKRRRPHLIEETRDRVILIAVPLIENDRALRLHVLWIEERSPHPVGLNVESQRQVLRR